ncbi:Uncharacterised protein [Mycobacterium tuberculosis]|nr:Uncharacterised protein [Mycobacterium tuberculosis]
MTVSGGCDNPSESLVWRRCGAYSCGVANPAEIGTITLP